MCGIPRPVFSILGPQRERRWVCSVVGTRPPPVAQMMWVALEVERADVGVSVIDAIHREEEQEKDASEDVCVDALEYVEKARDGETTIDVPVQKYCGADLKELCENYTEKIQKTGSLLL